MKRILIIVLVLWCVSSLTVTNTAAETKGALQAGFGAATTVGGPDLGLTFQVLTLRASGLLLPSDWTMINVGFSYGLPTTYEFKDEDSTNEIKPQSSYLDGMIGVYKSFSDGGMIYLGAGVSVAFGDLEISYSNGSSDYQYELTTNVGLVYGTGLVLPISDNFMGFISAQQRFIKNELEIKDSNGTSTLEMSIGGMEMVVGLALTLGG